MTSPQSRFLRSNGNSLLKTLQLGLCFFCCVFHFLIYPHKAYPEFEWLPWKFRMAPLGFWKTKDNQRLYFDWLKDQLQLSTMDDWYNITQVGSVSLCTIVCSKMRGKKEQIYKHGGSTLLHNYYKNSPARALMAIYPEYNWRPWQFEQVQDWTRLIPP